jgi:ABC-type spermidine/putrescine transport system permease subunit I
MNPKELTKLVGQIESETALQAFNNYLELQWANFYWDVFCNTFATVFLLSLFCLVVRFICKEEKRRRRITND